MKASPRREVENWVSWTELLTWDQTYRELKAAGEIKVRPPMFPVRKELNRKVVITGADITILQVDAIVNAANKTLLGGHGVDGAIHAAAGLGLYHECVPLNGCAVGEAKITSGHRLPARHVIHTVGPRGEKERDLQNCYEACLQLCLDHRLRTVAFPCISTGVFGYPEEPAAKVVLRTVRHWLEEHWRDVDCIIFCTFTDVSERLYRDLMPGYFPVDLPSKQQGDLNTKGSGPSASPRSASTH